MLCSILSILFFNSLAQDTTCTFFNGLRVLEFDYYKTEILYEDKQISKYYDIEIKYNNVLCLHLSDKKKRYRTVITTYFDGSISEEILESKDNVYFSPKGAKKVSVGKPKWFKI